MEVSRSGYYQWLKEPKYILPDILGLKIKEVFEKSRQTYGIRRIKAALSKDGIKVGRIKIKEKMKEYSLVCKAAKKYKATTNSNHKLPVAPNLLNQEFSVTAPNRIWVSDFTYLWTQEGWMYLAVVIHLFSRRVVGWSLSKHKTKEFVIEAMKMVIRQRRPASGLIAPPIVEVNTVVMIIRSYLRKTILFVV